MSTAAGLIFAALIALNYAPSNVESPEIRKNGQIFAAFRENTIEEPTSRYISNTEELVLLSVPFTHQVEDLPEDKKAEIRSTACGPASLAMVMNYLGEDYALYDVIDRVPTSVYVKGKMYYKLYEGPSYFGYEGKRFTYSVTALYEKLQEEKPVILNVQNYDGITGHAIVVVGMKGYNGKTAESLIAHDPWVEGYREFTYLNDWTLKQPEGFHLRIGHQEPFVIE
jgi:hypothetical protein